MSNWKSWAASIAAISLLAPGAGGAGTIVASRATARHAPPLPSSASREGATIAALRQRVKYVFVLYQENRSFDFVLRDVSAISGRLALRRLSAVLHSRLEIGARNQRAPRLQRLSTVHTLRSRWSR